MYERERDCETVACVYCRVMELCRPPRFSDLLAKIHKYYDRDFALCFVLASEQV